MRGNSVRDVTAGEVEAFRTNGWVKLERLVDPDRVADLFGSANALLSDIDDGMRTRPDQVVAKANYRRLTTDDYEATVYPFFTTIRGLEEREDFSSLARCPAMGRVAHALIDRASLGADGVATNLRGIGLICKLPDPGIEAGTFYHQDDSGHLGVDRSGLIQIWIALHDMTPDHGTMRFLSGSHRAGPLGRQRHTLLEDYPALTRQYAWSPPLQLRAGDATAHHQFTIHGTPPNVTDEPRIGLTCSYMAADVIVDPRAEFPQTSAPVQVHP